MRESSFIMFRLHRETLCAGRCSSPDCGCCTSTCVLGYMLLRAMARVACCQNCVLVTCMPASAQPCHAQIPAKQRAAPRDDAKVRPCNVLCWQRGDPLIVGTDVLFFSACCTPFYVSCPIRAAVILVLLALTSLPSELHALCCTSQHSLLCACGQTAAVPLPDICYVALWHFNLIVGSSVKSSLAHARPGPCGSLHSQSIGCVFVLAWTSSSRCVTACMPVAFCSVGYVLYIVWH